MTLNDDSKYRVLLDKQVQALYAVLSSTQPEDLFFKQTA